MTKNRFHIFKVLSILTFSISLFACSSTKIETFEDGAKVMYSKKKIQVVDFNKKNFFITEIKDSNFNSYIFEKMKTMVLTGNAQYKILGEEFNEASKEIGKTGELIYYFDNNQNPRIIFYTFYDEQKEAYIEYTFYLSIFEDAYKQYSDIQETLNTYITHCDNKINSCTEIIRTCSNPTIQKSRVVSVPYTVRERYWVPASIGYRAGGTIGSKEYIPGHYEIREYTAYKNETEYYTVPNPNYNPTKVEQAYKDITYWQAEKEKAQQDFKKIPLPFVLTS